MIFNGRKILRQFLDSQLEKLRAEIIRENKNTLLNYDETQYIDYIVGQYSIQPIIFDWENKSVSDYEAYVEQHKIPVYQTIFGGSSSSLLKQHIKYEIPFSGEVALLELRPSTFSSWSPEVEISNNVISFEIINWNNDEQAIKSEADRYIQCIQQMSSYSKNDIDQFNSNMKQIISRTLKERKDEILRQNNVITSLGVTIKKRESSSATFSVPFQRKPIAIKKPDSSKESYVPEPELDSQAYKQILKVCYDLGVEMERHPSTYQGKGEEALRDLFLMLLSPNFSSVTGETFNKQGKTDILIRHENKNVFVAECKFWKGPKLHQETIDQILSYLTWRESKAVIIYFVNNKNLQPVLDSIETETLKHACYVKAKEKDGEAWFNFHFHLLKDNTRGVELAVLVFHLDDDNEES
jgi:hypothetical protein